MSNTMKVQVTVVPSSGKSKTKTHEVAMTATTVGAMADELKLDLTKKTLYVNGALATRDTVVTPGAEIALRVTETPKGS